MVKENKRRGEPGMGSQGRGGGIPNTYIMLALFPLKCFSLCSSFEMFCKMLFVQTFSEMLLWFSFEFSFILKFNLSLHVMAYF